jgi:serine protease
MRRTTALGALTLALALSACADTADFTAPSLDPPVTSLSFSIQQAERVVPGRILVGLRSDADASGVAQSFGVDLAETGRSGRYRVMRGAAGSERAIAARMGSDDRVLWAEPDFLRQPTAIDPRLWAFHNPGNLTVQYTRGRNKGLPVSSLLSVEDADIDNAEGYASGGASVAIASIDTGVDMTHAEFGGATLVSGWDFIDNDADATDGDGHGTHTTGTMTGDNVGVAGVAGAAPNVTVHVFRVCGPVGCPTSAIIDAIVAAADSGVVAMNLSLGGGSLSSGEASAIDYAVNEKGSLVIASAGNGGTGTVSCPACDPNAISVAASDWLDELAYYSNWGSGLDITAPGGEMYSNTTEEAGIYSSVPGGYAYYQGTSMAAPQVTGAAAVAASVTGTRGAALRARLEGTTDDLGADGYDTRFGHGRLNAYRAATSDGDPPPPPPPPAALAAGFTYSCSGSECSFDGSSSTGSVTSYDWTFGEGSTGSGITTTHSFAEPGDYAVTLTVSDDIGGTDATFQNINCRTRGPRLRCQ